MSDVKVIDTKLSLRWLVSTGIVVLGGLVTTIWGVAGLSAKMDLVLYQTTEMRSAQSADHADINTLKTQVQSIESSVASNGKITDLRLDGVERALQSKIPARK